MKDILEEIVAAKRVEVAARKEQLPPAQLYTQVERLLADRPRAPRSMRQALAESASGIIAEFKRKSPSKGWIHQDSRPTEVVPRYAAGGASALSILTDAPYFGGSLSFIPEVRDLVAATPILRKDFIVDEYQLFEAASVGADAVLLIAADLTPEACRSLMQTAHQLQLETLLEVHDERDLDYVSTDYDMVGVNNRHLGTFHTDVAQSFALAERLPREVVRVAESGISQPDVVRRLRAVGYRGFLIGECFMRQADPGQALRDFVRCVEGEPGRQTEE
jgi:indole-3-glycerol phosphate synthase